MEKETKTRIKIKKQELLEKLEMEDVKVVFIQYDVKEQSLILDIVGEVEEEGGWFKF